MIMLLGANRDNISIGFIWPMGCNRFNLMEHTILRLLNEADRSIGDVGAANYCTIDVDTDGEMLYLF